MPALARRFSILQIVAVTTAVAAGLSLVYVLDSPPLGSLGLREASLSAAILLAAVWFCRTGLTPRLALIGIVAGAIAVLYFVRYLGASDLLFGHYRGPPQWLIASTWAAGLNAGASAAWLVTRVGTRCARENPNAGSVAPFPRRLPWLSLLGLTGLAGLCSLILLSGIGSLPRQQLEIDHYIKGRIVDSRLPLKTLAERLSRTDLPYRADLAASISLRQANAADAAAIPALAFLLEDSDPKIRYGAASALHMVFQAMPAPPSEASLDSKTRASILRCVNDPDPTIRSLALVITRGRPAVAAPPVSHESLDAVTVKRMVEALDAPEMDRRWQTLNILRTMGPRAHAAAPALEQRLSQGDVTERLLTAITLSYVDPGSSAAIEFLANSLVAPQQSPQLRAQAAQRLGELGPAARGSVPQFLEAFEKRLLPLQAAEALHRIDAEAAHRAGLPGR